MDLSHQGAPPKKDEKVGLIWVSGAVPFPPGNCGQGGLRCSQTGTPACCVGDTISASVLSLKCFDDNFKDNGMLLESEETVSLMQ